jgi:uncharacterized membrane protein
MDNLPGAGRLRRGLDTREGPGLALLALALLFNAILLASEVRIGRVPLNDSVFHRAAAERLGESLARGEPFLDPWVSEWSLGYPVWRTYQPLPHLVGTAWLQIAGRFTDPASAFAWLEYLSLVLLPASVYGGARLFGLRATAAGLASLLLLAPSAAGNFDSYGLSYGATTWRGSGLHTQVFALHLLAWSLGLVTRALDTGKGRVAASIALAATALSHIVFGYVAFASAAVLSIAGSREKLSKRLVRLATIAAPALCLLAWFVLPAVLSAEAINHSRWEAAWKWDSFGARSILTELVAGRLFDAGRAPVFSTLLLLGALAAAVAVREPLPRRLLALAGVWLALFFGRETWGHLLLLVGVPADLHLHRLQAAFELSAVLLAAWGIHRTVAALSRIHRAAGWAAAACVAAGLVTIGVDRAGYLRQNAAWGEENLAAYARERGDLDAALASVSDIVAARPGRVSAGKSNSWGREFRVDSVPVYAFLTRAHFDQVSFLYHSMSRPSDVMVLRDEDSAVHDEAFGVRAIVAPSDRPMPPHLERRAVHGRFAVYEADTGGYFSLVDVGARYIGPSVGHYEMSDAWLKSPLPGAGVVVALGDAVGNVPVLGRWEPLPAASVPAFQAPRGRIVAESKDGEVYRVEAALDRACYVLVKISWHPGLVATVDGTPASAIRVTPGFVAVPVPAGQHEVEVRYAPGLLKPFLLVIGIVVFAAFARAWPRLIPAAEEKAATHLDHVGARLATPRTAAALALAGLILLAAHPLFRGRLINGHDATAYPPRLAQMARALGDGHVPPVWAPDLGRGFGQPLFGFAPPLATAAAIPLHAAGLRLADALQMALALLYAAGAIAMYRLGRRMGAPRLASLAGAGAWLFAPYVALDLFVRAAFSEAAAVAVSPVALLGLLRALDRGSPSRVAMGAAGVALIPLAHNAAALLMLPVFGLLVLLRARTSERPLAVLTAGGVTLAAGLGLAAVFWVPALLEQRFVKLDLAREGYLDWSRHAVSLRQLLWSPWGYGLSGPGPSDGLSFALGPMHLLLAAAGLALALRSPRRAQSAEALAFLAVAIAGAWLATTWSAPLWRRVGSLQFLQFPWRTLMLPALVLPLLAVPAFARLGRGMGGAALTLLVVLNLPHTQPKGFLTFDDEFYAPESIASRGINTTTREEYEPRWVAVRPSYRAHKLTGLDASVRVSETALRSARQEFVVRADAATSVEASTFFYPGWTVTVDGQRAPVSVMEQSGTIVFPMPAGEHRVVLELLPTAVRFFSLLLSALTGVLLVFCATAVRGAVFRPKAAALALALGAAVLVAAFVARGRIVWGADAPSIMAAASEEATMKAGLDLLYEGRNPGAAEPFFRRVLERNPAHYGATYQLAVALDRTGKADEARRLWEAVLRMADGYKDSQTAATARARLAAPR